MATFTVRQLADMLKVNQETVRRWIRQGKLVATKESRNGGNHIEYEAIKDFCRKRPKYATKLKEDISSGRTLYFEVRFLNKVSYCVSSRSFTILGDLHDYLKAHPYEVIVDIIPEIGA